MQVARVSPTDTAGTPFSATHPASSTDIVVDTVEITQPKPGEALVRVHASSATRDELTWPETYRAPGQTLGYDVAGVLESVLSEDGLQPGDEVYAMASCHRGGAWAEHAVLAVSDLALKPRNLDWPHAASVPMSVLTAWQALFVHAGAPEPDLTASRGLTPYPGQPAQTVLITGASGAVGAYAVQLAAAAGLRVTAASTSSERNEHFLRTLGASEVAEYDQLPSLGRFKYDYVVDTVGGAPLQTAWDLVIDGGALVSVDSGSFAFAQTRPPAMENVKAVFFIVEPSGEQLGKVTKAIEQGLVETFVAYSFPLAQAKEAYEKANGRLDRRGKVVITM